MIYDRQCSSCGGFCGRGGCKRENVKPEPNLALPEPKPVVWIRHENEWVGLAPKERLPIETPRPDARKPLTDEDISAIVQSMSVYTWDAHMLARLIEKAHGIGE